MPGPFLHTVIMRYAAAVIIISLTFAACGGGADDRTQTAVPDPSAVASAAPTTEPTSQPFFGVIEISDAVDIPEGIALVIATGCWQCDGPTDSLVRIRPLDDGSIEKTTLRESPIGSYAVSQDGARIAVSNCVGESCGTLGVPPGPVSEAIVISEDGGRTFSDPVVLPGSHSVVGFSGDQLVMRGPYTQFAEDTPSFLYPSMRPLPPPNPEAGSPFALPAEVLWASLDRQRLLDSSGDTLLTFEAQISQVVPLSEDGSRIAIVTYPDVSTTTPRYRIDVAARTSNGLVVEASLENPEGFMLVGGALPDGRLAINISIPPTDLPAPVPGQSPRVNLVPALLDVYTATAHPVTEPFHRTQPFFGRNFIVAVLEAP